MREMHFHRSAGLAFIADCIMGFPKIRPDEERDSIRPGKTGRKEGESGLNCAGHRGRYDGRRCEVICGQETVTERFSLC